MSDIQDHKDTMASVDAAARRDPDVRGGGVKASVVIPNMQYRSPSDALKSYGFPLSGTFEMEFTIPVENAGRLMATFFGEPMSSANDESYGMGC